MKTMQIILGLLIGLSSMLSAQTCLDLDIYVNLEGAMVKNESNALFVEYFSEMRTDLVEKEILPGMTFSDPNTVGTETPAGNPFLNPPFNYGTETYDVDPSEGLDFTNDSYLNLDVNNDGVSDVDYDQDGFSDVVDFILVSFRTDTLNYDSLKFKRASALLLKNGKVVFLNNCILYDTDITGELYIVIEHASHMGIMTHESVPVINNTISYDFRIQNSWRDSPYYTGFGQKNVLPNATNGWAMFAGDGDQINDELSWDITGSDLIQWKIFNGWFRYYNASDFNLDGDTNATDKIVWNINNGISSRVPK